MELRKPYPTDLIDTQWTILAPLVPATKPGLLPETYTKGEIGNEILYLIHRGRALRMLPHDLPPRGIVYHYFRQWRRDGTWQHMNDSLRGDVRVLEGRNRQPSAGRIDSQSVKTTDRGGVK